MSAMAAFLTVAGIAALGILARIGLDFRAHHRRLRRMAAAAICSDAERHTGAVPAPGEATAGSGVNVELRTSNEERDPRRCVRCHHFHLDPDSLICGGCREVMSHTKRTNGGAA